jgi:hypothetical protein
MWCLIKKKIPTWDRMKLRKVEGPGRCQLCRDEEENGPHLFIKCPFARQCWEECSRVLGKACRWQGESVEEAWKDWLSSPINRSIKALPLILNWGIWLARNATVFKDKPSLPELLVAQGLNILAHFPQEKEMRGARIIREEDIDHNKPWDFFDGASQNNHSCCGGGEMFFFFHLLMFSK